MTEEIGELTNQPKPIPNQFFWFQLIANLAAISTLVFLALHMHQHGGAVWFRPVVCSSLISALFSWMVLVRTRASTPLSIVIHVLCQTSIFLGFSFHLIVLS